MLNNVQLISCDVFIFQLLIRQIVLLIQNIYIAKCFLGKPPCFSPVLNVFLCRVYVNTNDVALYCKLRNSQNVMVNPK